MQILAQPAPPRPGQSVYLSQRVVHPTEEPSTPPPHPGSAFLGANAMEAWPIALMHRRRQDLKSMTLSRFNTVFGQVAVDVLTECDLLGAIRLLRTSWDETGT
jgi:hypothetical protein